MKKMYRISVILSVISCLLFVGMLVAMKTFKIQQKYETSYEVIKEQAEETVVQVSISKRIYESYGQNEDVIVYSGEDNQKYDATILHKYRKDQEYIWELVIPISDSIWNKTETIKFDTYQSFFDILYSKFLYM